MKRNATSVRLERDEHAYVEAYVRQHQCTRSQAIRALLRVGHLYVSESADNMAEVVHRLEVSLADVSAAVYELRAAAASTNENLESLGGDADGDAAVAHDSAQGSRRSG